MKTHTGRSTINVHAPLRHAPTGFDKRSPATYFSRRNACASGALSTTDTVRSAVVRPLQETPKMRVHSRSRRFRDLSVAAKMTLAVGLAVVVTLVPGVLGLRALSTAADRTDQMHQQNVLGAQLAQEIRFQFLSSRFNSTSATYSTDPAAKQNDLTARDEARAALSDAA